MPFDLGRRTKEFALRIVRVYQALPSTIEAQVLGKQLLRSGTSVGAQYREAQRSRSIHEFKAKIESALHELEETGYWLELLHESKIFPFEKFQALYHEQQELIAIFVSSAKKAAL